MKEKILAFTLFVAIIAFVITNTLVIKDRIEDMQSSLKDIQIGENAEDEATILYGEFKKAKNYFSLSVNHEDLTNIEDSFVEMIGYLSVKNYKDAEVTKNRLICSLEHLRRLSGFTIDAII